MKCEFLNCFIVNLTSGYCGDCHRALNYFIYSKWSFLFPLTHDICISKVYKEVKLK